LTHPLQRRAVNGLGVYDVEWIRYCHGLRYLMFMSQKGIKTSEFQKFDAAISKIFSVPREELQRRKAAWKKQRPRKKRVKA